LSGNATLTTTASAAAWAAIASEPDSGRMDNVVAGWNRGVSGENCTSANILNS
jgi:hypothetical protein